MVVAAVVLVSACADAAAAPATQAPTPAQGRTPTVAAAAQSAPPQPPKPSTALASPTPPSPTPRAAGSSPTASQVMRPAVPPEPTVAPGVAYGALDPGTGLRVYRPLVHSPTLGVLRTLPGWVGDVWVLIGNETDRGMLANIDVRFLAHGRVVRTEQLLVYDIKPRGAGIRRFVSGAPDYTVPEFDEVSVRVREAKPNSHDAEYESHVNVSNLRVGADGRAHAHVLDKPLANKNDVRNTNGVGNAKNVFAAWVRGPDLIGIAWQGRENGPYLNVPPGQEADWSAPIAGTAQGADRSFAWEDIPPRTG